MLLLLLCANRCSRLRTSSTSTCSTIPTTKRSTSSSRTSSFGDETARTWTWPPATGLKLLSVFHDIHFILDWTRTTCPQLGASGHGWPGRDDVHDDRLSDRVRRQPWHDSGHVPTGSARVETSAVPRPNTRHLLRIRECFWKGLTSHHVIIFNVIRLRRCHKRERASGRKRSAGIRSRTCPSSISLRFGNIQKRVSVVNRLKCIQTIQILLNSCHFQECKATSCTKSSHCFTTTSAKCVAPSSVLTAPTTTPPPQTCPSPPHRRPSSFLHFTTPSPSCSLSENFRSTFLQHWTLTYMKCTCTIVHVLTNTWSFCHEYQILGLQVHSCYLFVIFFIGRWTVFVNSLNSRWHFFCSTSFPASRLGHQGLLLSILFTNIFCAYITVNMLL